MSVINANVILAAKKVARLADRLLELTDFDPEMDSEPASEETIKAARSELATAIYDFQELDGQLAELH